MIQGEDISIPTDAGAAAVDVCARIVRRAWPNAVVENAHTGETYLRYEQISFGSLFEAFIYRDTEAARQWDELGADPRNTNTMLHLLLGNNSITLVVDDAGAPEMAELIAAVREGLRMDILNLRAPMRAAA